MALCRPTGSLCAAESCLAIQPTVGDFPKSPAKPATGFTEGGAKTPRRITSRQVMDTASADARCPRGFALWLWEKIKRWLLLNK
ncbi:hypothetical protein RHMOL_Rhmol08G0201900 [Rhododendron molle]|uniref:Uncharacterized protein n=1 Tax=Rhododendron molle TaxID=49168 RepID=A0ACC0MSF7_RHOML|nr:hypothetical protein RHMOL_Rhmol08G0201900 [Rhododendron molle]